MTEAEIRNLEQQLLLEQVRRTPERVAELLADGFVEHCSSGRVYRYRPGDTFPRSTQADWEIRDFRARAIADGVVLATYRLLKHDEPDEARRQSLRSSIWVAADGAWKMVFHQGTPVPPPR